MAIMDNTLEVIRVFQRLLGLWEDTLDETDKLIGHVVWTRVETDDGASDTDSVYTIQYTIQFTLLSILYSIQYLKPGEDDEIETARNQLYITTLYNMDHLNHWKINRRQWEEPWGKVRVEIVQLKTFGDAFFN